MIQLAIRQQNILRSRGKNSPTLSSKHTESNRLFAAQSASLGGLELNFSLFLPVNAGTEALSSSIILRDPFARIYVAYQGGYVVIKLDLSIPFLLCV